MSGSTARLYGITVHHTHTHTDGTRTHASQREEARGYLAYGRYEDTHVYLAYGRYEEGHTRAIGRKKKKKKKNTAVPLQASLQGPARRLPAPIDLLCDLDVG
eukprot:6060249-Prymnesium_polylepis.1